MKLTISIIRPSLVIVSLVIVSLASSHSALAVDGTSFDPSQNLYSARQLGMGGAALAFADDANGVFSNPGGLTNLAFPQLVGASRKLVLEEAQYALFAWAWPTDWGTFGFGYTGTSTDGSLPTKLDPANGRIIQDPSREAISYGNNVLALSYTKKIQPNLAVGGSFKSINQFFSGSLSSKATGTGLDLGALYTANNWLTVGANLQNIVEPNLAWEGGASDKIGGFYKVGCKINVLGPAHEALKEFPQKLYAGIDYALPHSTLAGASYNLGLEYFPLEKIALRTGFSPTGFSLGIGLTNGGFRFDYAYAANSNIPGDTPHYFSLSYVGEREKTSFFSLKGKESDIVFLRPKDRFITDQMLVAISAEARVKRILDQKNVYTVTGFSASEESYEISVPEKFQAVYLNGQPVDPNVKVVSASLPLGLGRNVFQLVGHTSAEVFKGSASREVVAGSSEVKVLRVELFIDVPLTHWAREPIYLSSTLGLVKGYPDGGFKPDKGITRAELLTLLVRTLPVNLDNLTEFDLLFTDVPKTFWAAKYIAYGTEKQLATGYPDSTFKPNKVLTRAEGVTLFARYAGLTEEADARAVFPDLQDNFWANKYIAPAKTAGLLEYLTGKDFEPSTPFSRAEAAEVLYRTPRIQGQVNQWWDTGMVSAQQPTTTEAQIITSSATVEAQPGGVTTAEVK